MYKVAGRGPRVNSEAVKTTEATTKMRRAMVLDERMDKQLCRDCGRRDEVSGLLWAWLREEKTLCETRGVKRMRKTVKYSQFLYLAVGCLHGLPNIQTYQNKAGSRAPDGIITCIATDRQARHLSNRTVVINSRSYQILNVLRTK